MPIFRTSTQTERAAAQVGRCVVGQRRSRGGRLVQFQPPAILAVREVGVVQQLAAQRRSALGPRLAQPLRRGVTLLQPLVPLPTKLGPEHLRKLVKRSGQPGVEQAVLVVDLDHCHPRIRGVRLARIGITVQQQIPIVLPLQFDLRRIEEPHHVPALIGRTQPLNLRRQTVGGIERAVVERTEVDVDAALDELGGEVVESV